MRLTLHVHPNDLHRVSVLEGTPQGALPTEGTVHLAGGVNITGLAPALRKLAASLGEAAAQAELFDADPDAYRAARQAQRERDHELGEEGP